MEGRRQGEHRLLTMEATPKWEQSKENAAPLERGRNVRAFERAALQQQDDIDRMIEQYESLVKPSEPLHITEVDDDPLVHWLSYIKFCQESFPSDSNRQFLLMERCTRALIDMRQYADDERFIGVCAKYADKTKQPGQIFKFLHQKKIGSKTALFWIAWAFVAEKDQDFPFAEKVFKKGISNNAQPLQMLKIRHQQFQRRMSRYWLNSSPTDENLDDDGEDHSARRRGVLGGLSSDRASRNQRSRAQNTITNRSILGSNRSTMDSRNNDQANSSFPIFVEQTGENQESGYDLNQSGIEHSKRILDRDADRKKENNLEAERWNERGGFHSAYSRQRSDSQSQTTVGPPPPFAVFVDEECAARNQREEQERQKEYERKRRDRDERTFREREDIGMAERLARDPLRYVLNPSKLHSDQAEHEPRSRSALNSQIGKIEKKGRTGFSRRLLKDASNAEQCFEEARFNAGCFTLALPSTNFNHLSFGGADHNTSVGDSRMETDEDGSIEDVSMAESAVSPVYEDSKTRKVATLHPSKKTERQVLFKPTVDCDTSLNRTALSTASSTVNEAHAVGVSVCKDEETINTKFAMKELSMMFSSPAFGTDVSLRKGERSQSARQARTHEDDDDAEVSSYPDMAELVGQGPQDNSIFVTDDGNIENLGPRNPDARSNTTHAFENMALRELEAVSTIAEPLGCQRQSRRPLLFPAQGDPLRGPASELSSDPGFEIFQDDDENGGKSSDEDHRIGQDEATGHNQVASNEVASGSNFRIFEEEELKPPAASSFEIYNDGAFSDDARLDDQKEMSALGKDKRVPFHARVDDPDKKSAQADNFLNDDGGRVDSTEEEGDTATLSLFGNAFNNLDESSTDSSLIDAKQVGFGIYVDDDETEQVS